MRVALNSEKMRGHLERWRSMLDYLDPELSPSSVAVLMHFQNRTKGWRDLLVSARPHTDDHAAFDELLDELHAFEQIVSKMLPASMNPQSTSIKGETPNLNPDVTVAEDITRGEDEKRHYESRYDDWWQTDNRVSLPVSVVKKIQELIRRDDVQSVSCPYDDRAVWEILVREQLRRAAESDLPPQDVFFPAARMAVFGIRL